MNAPEPSPGNRAAVIPLDLEFMGAPEVVGAYLVPAADGREFLLVDCGPGSTADRLYAALERHGVNPADVRHLLLTHVHLDHAGAAGRLARELGLTVHAHERGAPHLARPERLLESAARIYGDRMHELWGDFEPVPPDRLNALKGGETLHLGGHAIGALYTPGHAVHHLAYALGDAVFTGDVGGVRLPGSNVVVAPTPPPDIDLDAWARSIAEIRAYRAHRLFPAHYGEITDVDAHLDRLEANLRAMSDTALEVLRAGGDRDAIAARLRDLAGASVERAADATLARRYELATPYLMAADGLIRYWRKRGAINA